MYIVHDMARSLVSISITGIVRMWPDKKKEKDHLHEIDSSTMKVIALRKQPQQQKRKSIAS